MKHINLMFTVVNSSYLFATYLRLNVRSMYRYWEIYQTQQ